MSDQKSNLAERYERATRAQNVLASSVKHLLKPLVRLMLRHGMPFQSFAQVAKRAYIEVAQEHEFAVPNKGQTKSRIALITGLTRPDVAELMSGDRLNELPPAERWNRAAAVLGGWATDRQYREKNGKPKTLPIRGTGQTFESLVRKYGADMPAVATLDELIRSGNVERIKGGKVRMKSQFYIPETESEDMLKYFGTASSRLLRTMVHNILDRDKAKHFQQEFWSRGLTPTAMDELRVEMRKILARDSKRIIKELEDKEELPVRDDHRTAGVGFYYFEE